MCFVSGLNCLSIMRHDTLVLTERAVKELEKKLLHHLNRAESLHKRYRYMDYKKLILNESELEEDQMPPFV